MTKADIVSNISKNLGIEKVDVQLTIESLMKEIINSLENGENVYSSRKLIINHLGFKSTSDFGEDLAHSNKLRSWHFAWSYFYYHKKNEGYFSAFMKSIGKICRSFLKMIFFSIIFNKSKRINYTYRFLGFVNSLFGRKSFFRIE